MTIMKIAAETVLEASGSNLRFLFISLFDLNYKFDF